MTTQVMGKEFNRRWLRAGDEERTNVPVIATDAHRQANPYLSNAYTNYNKSDVRVAKTDYIQLRDISLSYTVPKSFVDRLRLSSLALKFQPPMWHSSMLIRSSMVRSLTAMPSLLHLHRYCRALVR